MRSGHPGGPGRSRRWPAAMVPNPAKWRMGPVWPIRQLENMIRSGVDLAQGLVAQAPVGHGLRRERLGQHVGPAHQVQHDVAGLGHREVEGEVELAGVERMELQGVLLAAVLADEGVDGPDHVGLRLALDLDDGGTVIGQHPGGGGAGDSPHEVDDPEVRQRPGRRPGVLPGRGVGRPIGDRRVRGTLARPGGDGPGVGPQGGCRFQHRQGPGGRLGDGAGEAHGPGPAGPGHGDRIPVRPVGQVVEGQDVGRGGDGGDQQVVAEGPGQQLGLGLGSGEDLQGLGGPVVGLDRVAALHYRHPVVGPVHGHQLVVDPTLGVQPGQEPVGETGPSSARTGR